MAVFRISEKYQLENLNFKNRKFQNTSTLLSSIFLLLRPFLSDSCFVGRLRCAIWQNGTADQELLDAITEDAEYDRLFDQCQSAQNAARHTLPAARRMIAAASQPINPVATRQI